MPCDGWWPRPAVVDDFDVSQGPDSINPASMGNFSFVRHSGGPCPPPPWRCPFQIPGRERELHLSQGPYEQGETTVEVSGGVLNLRWTPSLDNPPLALCHDVEVATGPEVCEADASIDAGSYDADGDEITLTQDPPGPYGLGETVVALTVSDGSLEDTCQATVTVSDEAAPFVSCNAPPSISPWEVPVSFTATGTDNCGLRRVLARAGTCHLDWGTDNVPIQGQDTCDVVTQGDTITILNPGRSTEIRWLAVAIDQSGNRIVRHCSVDVVSELPPVGRK